MVENDKLSEYRALLEWLGWVACPPIFRRLLRIIRSDMLPLVSIDGLPMSLDGTSREPQALSKVEGPFSLVSDKPQLSC